MMMEWYRTYHGLPYDPKLLVIARRTEQPMAHVVAVWMCALDSASKNDPRGIAVIDAEEISVLQDINADAVEAIVKAFHDKGLIDEFHRLTGWDKRQHTSSTERMRKHRDTKKQKVTQRDTKKRHVTRSNKIPLYNTDTEQSRTDSEENTDTDKETYKENRAREEKKESEKEKHTLGRKQILHQMVDIWNEEVQRKITPNQKAILTEKRKKLLTARWQKEFAKDIQAWRYFCRIIGHSDFCLGKLEGKHWTIDLSWAIESPDHVAKILEGGFSDGKHPKHPPSCAIPELVDGWNEVLQKLEQTHSKAAVDCWFGNSMITKAIDTPDGTMLTLQVPHAFVRDWMEQHFLPDINRFWAEQHPQIIATKLTTKENGS